MDTILRKQTTHYDYANHRFPNQNSNVWIIEIPE
jgi:hypothetical protein